MKPAMTMEGHIIHRHHVDLRVQLYVPKEETFPIPLTHLGVTGTTHTHLDVLQEKRLDDYWNVDVHRSLSDSFTFIFTKNLQKARCGLGGDLQRFRQQPDLISCGLTFGLTCQKQLKRKRSKNGPSRNRRLDNARRLKGNLLHSGRWRV